MGWEGEGWGGGVMSTYLLFTTPLVELVCYHTSTLSYLRTLSQKHISEFFTLNIWYPCVCHYQLQPRCFPPQKKGSEKSPIPHISNVKFCPHPTNNPVHSLDCGEIIPPCFLIIELYHILKYSYSKQTLMPD